MRRQAFIWDNFETWAGETSDETVVRTSPTQRFLAVRKSDAAAPPPGERSSVARGHLIHQVCHISC